MECKSCRHRCEMSVENQCLSEISATIDYFNGEDNKTGDTAATQLKIIKDNIDILRDLLNSMVVSRRRTPNKKSVLRVSVLLDELLNIYQRKEKMRD